MNASGSAVRDAWRQFLRESPTSSAKVEPKLVVLHDELEAPLGAVVVRSGTVSAKGHNGLKSIQAHLGKDVSWSRIGIGIGRPSSRDPEVVSAYVLGKMSPQERGKIEGCVGKVVEELGRIRGRS
jgi:PTH1 family peptidyl-tRNA hydrolase